MTIFLSLMRRKKVVGQIDLKLDERTGNLKGIMPLAWPCHRRKEIIVADLESNAVAVIDVDQKKY